MPPLHEHHGEKTEKITQFLEELLWGGHDGGKMRQQCKGIAVGVYERLGGKERKKVNASLEPRQGTHGEKKEEGGGGRTASTS